MLELDHIAVVAGTLAEAVAHVETVLGSPMAPGGAHPRFGTHNQLLGMAPGLYLEAIAVDPSAPPPEDARWFGLDHFAGPARLDKWICRTDDLARAMAVLPMAGRRVDMQRGDLRWSMAVPEDGALPFDGLFPALLQWHCDVPPGRRLSARDARLLALTVSHPQADALQALLAPHLSAPLVRFETGAAGLSARVQHATGEAVLA